MIEDSKESTNEQGEARKEYRSLYDRKEEYFEKLEKWTLQYQSWYAVSLSFYLAYHATRQTYLIANQHFQQTVHRTWVNQHGTLTIQNQNRRDTVPPNEFYIPPLWKRFTAEFLDFFILFFFKVGMTFIAVDVFHLIDLDKYDIDNLQEEGKLNYEKAFEITSEIMLLEMVHRTVVCLYEAYWLHFGYDGHTGGCTPGKAVMGLRVIQCSQISLVELHPNMICHIEPATNLGWLNSFYRAFVKNLVIAFMFPVCFGLFIFNYNRTFYDIICSTVVVEQKAVQRQHTIVN